MTYVTQGLFPLNETSFLALVNDITMSLFQGLFELRSGSAEIALTYFDSAISLQVIIITNRHYDYHGCHHRHGHHYDHHGRHHLLSPA